MYQSLGTVVLKSGEPVAAGVVKAPDPEWAARIEKLLEHKGDPWNWQNTQCLRRAVGMEVCYFILHRGQEPFSNILVSTLGGVGNFGHVWTEPADRKQGACSALMELVMAHFREHQGRALFLFTEYGTPAYHIYQKFGFKDLEGQSGFMEYCPVVKNEFDGFYFSSGPAEIKPVDWPHWAAATALFTGSFPGIVRCVPLKLFGRCSTERPLLLVIRDQLVRQGKKEAPRALVLQHTRSTAVCGLAVWDWHPWWPATCVLDIYCHPLFWDRAPELLDSLVLPPCRKCFVYAEKGFDQKHRVLRRAGFKQQTVLPRRIPYKNSSLDVLVFEK